MRLVVSGRCCCRIKPDAGGADGVMKKRLMRRRRCERRLRRYVSPTPGEADVAAASDDAVDSITASSLKPEGRNRRRRRMVITGQVEQRNLTEKSASQQLRRTGCARNGKDGRRRQVRLAEQTVNQQIIVRTTGVRLLLRPSSRRTRRAFAPKA